jgi:hypothetical protein
MMTNKVRLKELLADDIDGVIFELGKLLEKDSQYYSDLILIKSRLNEIKRGMNIGILSHNEFELKMANIRFSVIGLINTIPDEKDTKNLATNSFDTTGIKKLLKSNLRSDLLKQHNVYLKLDKSPDGIERYLKISRSSWEFLGEEIEKITEPEQLAYSIYNLSERISKLVLLKDYIDLDNSKKVYSFDNANFVSLEGIINDIKEYTNKLSLLKNIGVFDSSQVNEGPYYISRHNIRHILPRTTFSQIIGDQSSLNKLADKFSFFSLPYDKIEHKQKGDKTLYEDHFSSLLSNKHFAFNLLGEDVYIVDFDKENSCKLKEARPLVDEDINYFAPSYFIQSKTNCNKVRTGKLSDFRGYMNDLFTILKSEGSINLKFKVKRSDLVRGMISLTDKIDELHKKGLIHGDLNPKNILTLKDGFFPIDPINIPIGTVSPGLTPNYCAPEQVLRKKVNQSTDIYNLGLILIMITEGILYGKVDKFVFPSSRSELEEAVLLVDPKIYFNPGDSTLRGNSVRHWTEFIEKCIKFEQEDRFSNIEEFKSVLLRLHKNHKVRGEIEFKPAFGGLSMFQTGEENKGKLGRVLDDEELSGESVKTIFLS